mmetsp:Transcript_30352/g.67303  ORF Transcript_30352/g.67303 Transcript_30352/m.67303 type:complete len:106 (-) Transcript_30352:527-844(-)
MFLNLQDCHEEFGGCCTYFVEHKRPSALSCGNTGISQPPVSPSSMMLSSASVKALGAGAAHAVHLMCHGSFQASSCLACYAFGPGAEYFESSFASNLFGCLEMRA